MKKITILLLVAVVTTCLTSCGDFMTGLASGFAGYGGGGYYASPAPTMYDGSNFNTITPPTPTFTFTQPPTPTFTFTAPAAAPASSYSSGSSSSSSSSSSNSGRNCTVCSGLGKCRTCNGTGTYWDSLNGVRQVCPNCKDGKCTSCGGLGRHY